MSNISHKDFACLLNMLDCIKKIQSYSSKFNHADDFYNNNLSFDATMMNFIVIGKMVDKFTDLFLEETSGNIDWHKVS
ncbi:MAG: hypothetical protein EHM93_05860 [Bacteroidales bacterium]|nr:MAG: hypothetical protein EHM93_05860 [Bacteroidales bacterium]